MSKIFSWMAVLLVMFLIFNLSSQTAEHSNELSTRITELIVKTAEKIVTGTRFDRENINNRLRKNAHFFSYLLLGVFVYNALQQSGLRGRRCFILALGICVLYAITDEVHQLYVPGRGGQVRDVLIDSAGACVGVGLYQVLGKKM
ncbi:MAG: VanZ family protein [Firmicutes bacterium]|nr:VanZ family protein [Bacillota bacterium]